MRISLIFVVVIFVIAHGGVLFLFQSQIQPRYVGKSFEDPTVVQNDASYHLLAFQSLFAKSVSDKFQKSQSMEGKLQRELSEKDFPSYASRLMALYPFPTVKSGYVLTAAALSGWVPEALFHSKIRRFAFVNLILNALSVILLFRIVFFLSRSSQAAVFASLFFLFDVSNTYNSYSYLSHTICGIFYVLLSLELALRKKLTHPMWAFLFGGCLCLAVLSSPHVAYLALLLGGFLILQSMLGARAVSRAETLSGVALGAFLFPCYFWTCETWLGFQSLGIPTFGAQLNEYRRAASFFRQDFAVTERFLWAPQLFHFYFTIVLCLAMGLLLLKWFQRQEENPKPSLAWGSDPGAEPKTSTRTLSRIIRALLPFVRVSPKTKWQMPVGLAVAIIFAWLVTAVTGLAISRAATPYTLALGVFFGAWVGCQWFCGKLARSYAVLLIFLTIISWCRFLGIVGTPLEPPSGRIVFFETQDRVLSVRELLRKHQVTGSSPVYLCFDPVSLVSFYVSHRRFYRKYSPDEPALVTPNLIETDFPLLRDLFSVLPQKNPFAVQGKPRRFWPFSYWDQEHFYLLGYLGKLTSFLKGTPLEQVDPRLLYFLNLSALVKEGAKTL